MYRFALRPRWILGHLVAIALVLGMVGLGFWQLRRLDERQSTNRALESRGAAPTRTVLPVDVDPDAAARYRFSLEGRFDAEHEVLVRGRIQTGLPGYEVLTPLVIAPGEAVLVNRGWIPQQIGDAWPDAAVAPPSGQVTVVGTARRSEGGALRPSEGVGGVPVISSIRLHELEDSAVPYELAAVWLVAERGATRGDLPAPLPPPDLSDGPHLSYAVQWFLFATIGAVGWVLLVRQSAQRRQRGSVPDGPSSPASTQVSEGAPVS